MLKIIKTFVVFQRSKKGNYWLLATTLALAVLTTLLQSILGPYSYSLLIDNLERSIISHEISWQNAISIGLISYLLLTVATYIVQSLEVYAITKLENRTIEKIDNFTAKHILGLSLEFFKDNFTGSLVSKQTTFGSHYERLFDTIYWEIIPTIVIVSCSLPIIFMYSWILGVILTAYAITYVTLSYTMSQRVRKTHEEFAKTRTKHTGLISDQIGNIQTVKFFGRDDDEIERYSQWNTKKTSLRITTWMKDYWHRQGTNGLKTFTDMLMIAICFMLWSKGDLNIGGIILAMTYNSRISDRMWQLGNVIKTLRTVKTDCIEMMEILEIKPTVVDVAQPLPCKIVAGHIFINNITFTYPGNDTKVFDNFSLEIPAGQKVGIVGESGSGKSTLMHLLMRMMDLQDGEITIDGTPIHLVRQQELRQKMSIVPQDTVLFHRTVFENIAYDRPDANIEEVITAAKKAQAHEFISALSNHDRTGYDVKVGERGIKLSGGQRQRIGLARAFLQHKPLLILDEATSSLDSLSEKKIQRALENLLHEQGTMIIIAHRLSTVHQLDRIIVMDKGEIIQDGTPDELYAIEDGAYRKLVDAQQLVIENNSAL